MWRLTERIVRSGLVMAWRLATSPISTSPPLEKATTDGVVRDPSELGITTGSPASRTETTELVVPRSMPTALGIWGFLRDSDELGSSRRIEVECPCYNFAAGVLSGIVRRNVAPSPGLLSAQIRPPWASRICRE